MGEVMGGGWWRLRKDWDGVFFSGVDMSVLRV